ncbi:MAG: ABC transporter ATP-binding protein [Deltaproteobacteria bacterium]|nr:ABC transporter ATP-binding protein [Deltaproteobacteria bacterium]
MLEIKNLSRSFGGLQAVSDISFSLVEGMIKAVIGPNGAGKTTLFNLICGNIPLSAGTIRFQGQHIERLKSHQIAALGMSRTFQNIKIFPGMTALENVMVGCHTRSRAGFIAAMLRLPQTFREEREIRRRSLELLELVEIPQTADCEAASLSFGQQRAVELARALAAGPSLLLLDEPAAGLNIYETAELARLITKIKELGVTILLVEHDMSLVMDISDEIVVLDFGRKLAEDIPARIQQNRAVIQVYLGDDEDA